MRKVNKIKLSLALSLAILVCGAAQAALYMPLVYDTYVDEAGAVLSTGSVLRIQGEDTDYSDMFNPTDTTIQRTFLQFDLSSLPIDATITYVEFGIYLSDYSELLPPNVQLWDIANHNWDNSLTWSESLDLLGNESALGTFQAMQTSGQYYVWNWSTFGNWDYTDAMSDGKVSFMLTSLYEDEFSFGEFYGSDSDFQPYLKIGYIPEPASISLLVLGGLFMLKKKISNR